MPSPPDRAFNEYTDQGSNFLRSSNWVLPGATLVGLYAALQNASNANLLYATSGAPIVGTFTPAAAQYPLVSDLAVFNFQTVPGSGCQLVVPAPLAALFGPTTTVVDPTATLSAAIIAAAVGLLTDVVGNPATAFISGSKASRRTEQVSG
jgi:hypothetical protein